ncbi:hypothetical protein ACRYJU_14860 [Alloalcanivorax xenomutans]|uniref:hypothetical protein n=1 Tax=Alloalcanivorax xenomutans TaxID=1094342 RepID=UPI003D9BE827
MPKQSWNNFKKSHAHSICFSAGVSSKISSRKGTTFDLAGNKLPTPYGLFLEWARASFKGDWASLKIQGGFAILVSDPEDANRVVKAFGKLGQAKRTRLSPVTQQIGYRDQTYPKLAKAFGYALSA